MTNWRYATPVVPVSDPIVCRTLSLQPPLWAVLFNELQRLSDPDSWRKDDIGALTPEQVAALFRDAADTAVFAGCAMIGQIVELALDTVPNWLLLCDGSSYLDVDYPELGAVIHANLREGPDGFRVPDRLGRFGLGGGAVGTQGGEAQHTLTIAEIPSHSHTVIDPGLNIVQEGAADPVLSDPGLPTQSGDTGGGQPHNNMPPYEYTQYYIIARQPT